jgi:monoamine oxidase
MDSIVDVVIVGGGVSGLSAAHFLATLGITNYVILEAKDREGGRLFATDVATASGSNVFDLGGQWIGPGQVSSSVFLLDSCFL